MLRDGDVAVYRRRDATGGAAGSVLAVIPNSDQPLRGCLDRLRHEYELKDALESQWAVRPLELVQEEGRPLLLLEDPGGEFLEGLLGQPMAVGPFLRLGIGLARALAKLHRSGLIHKDIKPAHILVDQASGAAWLTGFGIATPLPRERQTPEPPEILAGTLAYMAPEQTGRMNRSIRLPQRPLFARRHFLPNAHRRSTVQGHRSHGVGPLPYREETGAPC